MIVKREIIDVLKNVQDPELGLDLYTLGLIYGIDFDEERQKLDLTLTFTTPLCPYGPQMVADIKRRLAAIGLNDVKVAVVFDPPWEPSPEVREMLGV